MIACLLLVRKNPHLSLRETWTSRKQSQTLYMNLEGERLEKNILIQIVNKWQLNFYQLNNQNIRPKVTKCTGMLRCWLRMIPLSRNLTLFLKISSWQLSMDLQWKQKWSAVLMTAKSIRNFLNLSKRKDIIYKTLRKPAERIKQW